MEAKGPFISHSLTRTDDSIFFLLNLTKTDCAVLVELQAKDRKQELLRLRQDLKEAEGPNLSSSPDFRYFI